MPYANQPFNDILKISMVGLNEMGVAFRAQQAIVSIRRHVGQHAAENAEPSGRGNDIDRHLFFTVLAYPI